MAIRFTYEDRDGSTRFKAWALPVIVAAICVPILIAFSAGSQGPALGGATAVIAAAVIIVLAARSRPFAAMEVAAPESPGRRVLVLATGELDPGSVEQLAILTDGAVDVRVLVPLRSSLLDRWLSSEDGARDDAGEVLAASAGALTAAGIRVSGSVGDSDLVQAVEDELRSFAADEVVVSARPGEGDDVEKLRHRLAVPLTRLTS